MRHLTLLVLLTLIGASCTEQNEFSEEFPPISEAEMRAFLSNDKSIFLSYNSVNWRFGVGEMQASGYNFFTNCDLKDSLRIGAGLVHPDQRFVSLQAGTLRFDNDSLALEKHFALGDKSIGCSGNCYSLILNQNQSNFSSIKLHHVKVVKTSNSTQLYWQDKRKIKVWFLLDFDLIDSSGSVIEKARNAKYIHEFFLIDFPKSDGARLGLEAKKTIVCAK